MTDYSCILKCLYNLERLFYNKNLEILSKIVYRIMKLGLHSSIHYKAKIGDNFKIIHGYGLVIGSGVVAGKNLRINQQVTIGGNWRKKKRGRSYPLIGDNVWIMSGSKVLGPIKIGNNVVIGANSVVIHDVESNCVVGGVPAKVLRKTTGSDRDKINEG